MARAAGGRRGAPPAAAFAPPRPSRAPPLVAVSYKRPDHVTFNAAGAAAAKSGRWRDAEMVLDQSRRYKRSHIILYTSVIGACGRAREKGRALNHLARLREERGRADVFAFTAAVDACARAGKE